MRESEGVQLKQCESCDLRFFSGTWNDLDLSRMYNSYRSLEYQKNRSKYEPWYTKKLNDPLGHNEEVLLTRKQHLEALIKQACLADRSSIPRRILYVGGDEGQFIPSLATLEATAVLEVSNVKPQPGVEVVEDWREAADFKPDMVLLCHVLEHLDDPRSTLKNISNLLAPGHLFYVEIPLDNVQVSSGWFRSDGYRRYLNLLCRIPVLFILADAFALVCRLVFGRLLPGAVVKRSEHVNYFNSRALTHVITQFGFELLLESVYSTSADSALKTDSLGALYRKIPQARQ